MFYEPNYCCQCGDKIEKAKFSALTDSGRFCDVCRHDFPFQEYMPKVFAVLCGLFGLFGIGSYLIGGDAPDRAALKQSRISAAQNTARTENAAAPAQNANSQKIVRSIPESEAVSRKNADKISGENRTSEVVKAAAEKTYFCGAMTKKGTPCSRKVKGGGRCWQHAGQEAMAAQEKLLIGR